MDYEQAAITSAKEAFPQAQIHKFKINGKPEGRTKALRENKSGELTLMLNLYWQLDVLAIVPRLGVAVEMFEEYLPQDLFSPVLRCSCWKAKLS